MPTQFDVKPKERLRVVIHGAVQGVGFRPFIHRLATSLGLAGWVNNTPGGVVIEVEGPTDDTGEFLRRLESDKPPAAYLQGIEPTHLAARGYDGFAILPSEPAGERSAFVVPDLATCPECAAEIADPANRRYGYPFTNCTNCGPRYSIIESVPYDRPNTTMRHFTMCADCQAEYDNPEDRRFHAQPNACPKCGPQLALANALGATIAVRDDALLAAAKALLDGQIVALKGIGGFQLLVDATNDVAVQRLRERKRRVEKPFAVMYPSLAEVKKACSVNEREARLLQSPQAPIVLLERGDTQSLLSVARVADSVAPGNPDIGAMLPYTPLHRLLLDAVMRPVVATSGNVSDEPICLDNDEALDRLADIADVFLLHDRPIARHVDDSVARMVLGREMILRRARGYAPLPIALHEPGPSILAVGAHQKNTVALSSGEQAIPSQHIGDLDTVAAGAAFRRVIGDLSTMYAVTPAAVACDCHPAYASSVYAHEAGLPVIEVQHHYAHALSCMADNHIEAPTLAIVWDGSGWGPDGTVWGGEFLAIDASGFERAASFRPFRLLGGEKAVREPRRCAIGALYQLFGEGFVERFSDLPAVREFNPSNLKVLLSMLRSGLNSPYTSSAGRLFDVVASLAGVRQTLRHEGQAAMALEFAARGSRTPSRYPITLSDLGGRPIVDWEPLINTLLADVARSVPVATIARRFHNTLAYCAVLVADATGRQNVVLSGGCFQNRLLTELCVASLRDAGFTPYWHQRIPPNDGGIALGQLIAARAAMRSAAFPAALAKG